MLRESNRIHFSCYRLSNHDTFVRVAIIATLMMLYLYFLTPTVDTQRPSVTATRAELPAVRLSDSRTTTSVVSIQTTSRHVAEPSLNVTSGHSRINTTRTAPPSEKKALLRKMASSTERIVVLAWTEIPKLSDIQCNNPRPCVLTTNRSLYKSSDAVIVDMRQTKSGHDVPTFRRPNQYWIAYFREAPSTTHKKVKQDHAKSWFNWTIAYTMNSDVVAPYGMCLPMRHEVDKDPSSISDVARRVYGKSVMSLPWLDEPVRPETRVPVRHRIDTGKSLVAWVVSHCNSFGKREIYVAELKQHIDIDIFGKCAGHDVENHGSRRFFAELFDAHKFYLAFENSFCRDYVTEKVWSRMKNDIVPIVLGGADYEKHLPPHSYINVKDFPSPKHLAKYLHKLDNDNALYREYFAWKSDYSCFQGVPGPNAICDICRMISEHRVSVIPDINTFWDQDSCMSPQDYYRGIFRDITNRTISEDYGPNWPSFS